MTSIQEGTQVPVTHVGQSHPAKTFNGSHPHRLPHIGGLIHSTTPIKGVISDI